MWRPDRPPSPALVRSCAALATVALASCGGGSDSLTPQQQNPAAGIYVAADDDGNPASVLITPAGQFAAIVSSRDAPASPVSSSSASGELATLVFTSSALFTHDLPTGSARTGTLTVTYRQSATISAKLDYIVGARTIAGDFWLESFSTPSVSSLPSVAGAALYLPAPGSPRLALNADWAFSAVGMTFDVRVAGCTITGKLSADPAINAFAATASASEDCAIGSASFTGYLWRDAPRGYAHAVLKATGQSSAPPLVITIKL